MNSPIEVAGGCRDADGEEPGDDGDDAPDSMYLDIVEERHKVGNMDD